MLFNINLTNIYLFIFVSLMMPGLCCGMWNLVPPKGIEPGPSALGAQVLATGPPGKAGPTCFRRKLEKPNSHMAEGSEACRCLPPPLPLCQRRSRASKLRMGVVPVLPAHPCPLPSIVTFHCPVVPWEEVPVPTTALPWRCASWPWRALRRDAGGRGADQVTAGLDGVVSEVDEMVSEEKGAGLYSWRGR